MLFRRRTYLDVASGQDGNASSPHAEGRAAKRVLDEARRTIARLLEVQSDEVLFTSGATEANALAILGRVRASRKQGIQPRVLYLPSAHASIVENVRMLENEGAHVEPLVIVNQSVDCEALAKQLRPETVLITMEAVCGETGVIWNTHQVSIMARKHGVTLHIDASQAVATEKITRAHFGADLLTLDGAKVGVRGIGVLVAPRIIPLSPLYAGGGQERGLRPGSEVPQLAQAFANALTDYAMNREAFRASAEKMRAELVQAITDGRMVNIFINEGRGNMQVPHILNISLTDRDTDYLVALLNEAGFAVSTRSACETDSSDGSRAVHALFGDQARAVATLRTSWGPKTSPSNLRRYATALTRAVAFLDQSRAQKRVIDTHNVR